MIEESYYFIEEEEDGGIMVRLRWRKSSWFKETSCKKNIFKYLFIYLAVPGLSCGMQDL